MSLLQRLHPSPARLDVEEALDALTLPDPPATGRPYVLANLLGSVDGRSAEADALTGPTDRALFHALRGRVDAVLLGARTAAAEISGRLVPEPERRAARVARGLSPEPIGLIVSGPAEAPSGEQLSDPEARPVVLTGEAGVAAALQRARGELGIRSIVAEAGPEVTGRLLAEGAVDELFVTVSPLLVGGGTPLALDGGSAPVALELAWVLEADDCLFLRYLVRRGADR